MINGIAALTFVFMMISGMVLWWFNSKAQTKQCLTGEWNGKWRRVDNGPRNILGFRTSF